MKVPSKLVEKTLSALQIAKLTGKISTGLFNNMRIIESNKIRYAILALDAKPKNNKLKKKFLLFQALMESNNIFCMELCNKKELGKLVGLNMGTSSVVVLDPGRAKNIFKSLKRDMED